MRTQPYLPQPAEGDVERQGEEILHQLLKGPSQLLELLLLQAESQQDPRGDAEGQGLGGRIDGDGARLLAPAAQLPAHHLLDAGQVALQGGAAEDSDQDLTRRKEKGENRGGRCKINWGSGTSCPKAIDPFSPLTSPPILSPILVS